MPPKKKARRRLSRAAQQLLDDEAEESADESYVTSASVQNVLATYDSPSRPLNLSAFAGRPSSSPGGQWTATLHVLNNFGVVRITLSNGQGDDYSENVNKVMRAARGRNGSFARS